MPESQENDYLEGSEAMEYHAAGEELIRVLGLRVKLNGRVDLKEHYGDKTPMGLARTVERILIEHRTGKKTAVRPKKDEAYELGWAAYEQDKPADDNPFQPYQNEYNRWYIGWSDAEYAHIVN